MHHLSEDQLVEYAMSVSNVGIPDQSHDTVEFVNRPDFGHLDRCDRCCGRVLELMSAVEEVREVARLHAPNVPSDAVARTQEISEQGTGTRSARAIRSGAQSRRRHVHEMPGARRGLRVRKISPAALIAVIIVGCGVSLLLIAGVLAIRTAGGGLTATEQAQSERPDVPSQVAASAGSPTSPNELSAATDIVFATPSERIGGMNTAGESSRQSDITLGTVDPAIAVSREQLVVDLGCERLPTLSYALSQAGIMTDNGTRDVSTDVFRRSLDPFLQPVDQAVVYQEMLAAISLYPSERIDGKYGPRFRSAIEQLFDSQGKPRPARIIAQSTNTLSQEARQELFRVFEKHEGTFRLSLSLSDSSRNTLN